MSNTRTGGAKPIPGFLRDIDVQFRLVASGARSRSAHVDASPAPPSPLARTFPWLVLLGTWGTAARVFGGEWSAAPQYHYGWAVPALCAWLFWQRWADRPAAQPARASVAAGLVFALLFLPLRLVLEAFPDWRPALWLLAVLLTGVSLWWLHTAGGARWAGHFAFPVLFVLTGVPWPTAAEGALIHGLMRWNASLATEVVTALGLPAIQRGAVIDLGTTLVGVDEACSGIRSLQASLMLALLSGEIFRVARGRRIALVVIGVALALATNFARTLWLIWTAARSSTAMTAEQHDSAGVASMLVCVVGVALLGYRWRQRSSLAAETPSSRNAFRPPLAASLGIIIVLGIGEIGTELWFRLHENRRSHVQSANAPLCDLTVHWPTTRADFRQLAIRPAVKTVLNTDSESAATWREPEGATVVVHLLRWEPRPVREAMLAKYHTPDVCLPAAGCLLRDRLPTVSIEAPGGTLPFQGFLFEEEGRPLHVYYLLAEDRNPAAGVTGFGAARLRLVRDGLRRTGQTVLHVAIRNAPDSAAAEAILRRELSALSVGASLGQAPVE